MTGVKTHAIDYRELAPRAPEGHFDLNTILDGTGPIELDIGFGRGASLITRSEQSPDRRLIGIEIKAKWATKVHERIVRLQRQNVRVFAGDAKEILARVSSQDIVDAIFVHFPDPWWKKRHAKRRLVDSEFATLCASLLRPGGRLVLQTDVEARASEATEICRAIPAFDVTQELATHLEQAPSNRERRARLDGLPYWRVTATKAMCAPLTRKSASPANGD